METGSDLQTIIQNSKVQICFSEQEQWHVLEVRHTLEVRQQQQ